MGKETKGKENNSKNQFSIKNEVVHSKIRTTHLYDLLSDLSEIKKKLSQNDLEDESHLADIIMHMLVRRLKNVTNIN